MDGTGTTVTDPQVPALGGLDLIDVHLPAYDVALTAHLVLDADPTVVFAAARDFDWWLVRPLVAHILRAVVRTVQTNAAAHR